LSSKTVWIILSSRKGGHIYPGRALYEYMKKHGDAYCPEVINALEHCWPLSYMDKMGRLADLRLRSASRSGYRRLQHNNKQMKSFYQLGQGLLYKSGSLRSNLLREYGNPDLIISLQPEINAMAGLFKSWFSVPFHTVIIDLAIHGLWIDSSIDNYYVPNEPLKHELMRFGVPEGNITVAGMPLREAFASVTKKSVKAIRGKLGVSVELKTVLLVGGLLGRMLDFEGAIRSIVEAHIPVQILAVFGENEAALKRASVLKQQFKYPMHIFRTVTNMDELMWASDVVISKPGSVTMAEVLSLGKPLIAINPLAGSAQELRFARFLAENGAGVWIRRVEELGAALKDVMGNQRNYTRMSEHARRLGQYGLTANKTILETIKRSLADREAE